MLKFETAVFESAAGMLEQLPEPVCAEVVFSGRSNVGKSSLINKLLNRKSLARVSATPGKTITINFYRLNGLRLVDLPGYGYARSSQSEKARWSSLVEGYFQLERPRTLVLQLIDMRHSPTQDDLGMLHYLQECRIPFAIVLTKCDKLNKTERTARLAALEQELDFCAVVPRVEFSAVSGVGAEEIRNMLRRAAESDAAER